MTTVEQQKEERTFVLIKPDGVKRGLIGECIKRFEQRGLKIIALKMIWASREHIDGHLPRSREWMEAVGQKSLNDYKSYGIDPVELLGTDDPVKIGQLVREWGIEFLTSGPMVAMVVKGIHAIAMVRKIVGNTLPSKAEMGTIRGDYSVDSAILANSGKRAVHNLVHASGDAEEAAHEIKHWFLFEEIHDYKRAEEDIMF
jgi:nucleoside-diphosphate kinase